MSLAQLLRPRICELGKIKIGGLGPPRKSQSGSTWRPPVKLDSFRVTTLQRNKDGDLIDDVALMDSLRHMADQDGKLRQLPISLLSNELEEVLQASWMWFNGKRCAASSDGTTLRVNFDHQQRVWLDKPKEIPWEPRYAELKGPNGVPLFKLHCTLNVVIISETARWGGLYKFRTTSRITGDQLYGSLIQLKQLTGGQLRGLPLRLVVRPMQVAPEGKVTTVYVVHVEIGGANLLGIQRQALELAQFEVQNARQLQEARNEYRRLICNPDHFTDPEDEENVAQEFAPAQQAGQAGAMPGAAANSALPPAKETPPAEQPPSETPAQTATSIEPGPPAQDVFDPPPAADSPVEPENAPPNEEESDGPADPTPLYMPEDETPPFEPTPQSQPASDAPSEPEAPRPMAAAPIGGELVGKILAICGEIGVDWGAIRANKLGAGLKANDAGGIAQVCGFTPGPALKCKDLAADAGMRLYEILKAKVEEKRRRAAGRKNGQPKGAEA